MHVPRRALVAGIAGIVVAGVTACAGPAQSDRPTSIRIAVASWHVGPTWDVSTASLWTMSASMVYEPLIIWDDEQNTYAPGLAEEYEISEDGLRMSVTLRENVRYSDGTALDAEGATQVLNAAWGEGGAFSYLAPIGPEATATGEYTLELTTTKPLYHESEMLIQMASIPIITPAAIDDPSVVADGPIGTGPYLLEGLDPDVSASFVRNPDYWNTEAPGAFDELTLVVMDDKVAALNALKSGQIDAAEIDSSLAAEAEASGLSITTGSSAYIPLIILDRLGVNNPPLGDVRVRQALSYAIDREAIVDEIERGYGDASSQPFDPASREYVEGGDDRYAYDPDKARTLLADAGYPDGFTITLPRREYSTTSYLPIVEQYFADIGVTVEWVPPTEGIQQLAELEVDATLYLLLYSFTIGSFSTANQPFATQPVEDPEFIEMIERYNGSPAEHDSVLDEAAEYVLEQAWYIVISKPQTIWASNPEFDVSVAGGQRGTVVPRPSWFTIAP